LSSGLKGLTSGSNSLRDGLQDVNEGAIKLRDGLKKGFDNMSSKLKFNSENMSQFISNPVALKDSPINDVKRYGEGLAPYFISLSLWLGAMFISLVFSIAKSLNIFKNRLMNCFIVKFAAGSALVSIQALILSFALRKGLGISPVSILGFYLTNIFIAIVFFSIMYGLSHAIGIMSAPIMFIVLILQLASSGGTFPIETAPAFYMAVGRFIPMTYSVNTLRMVISGINTSLLNHNIKIMLAFPPAFLLGGLLINWLLNLKKKENHITNNTEAA
jgi:putative membrane protein